jgi:hypothetical protein
VVRSCAVKALRVFLSSAQADAGPAGELWRSLGDALEVSPSYRWELWGYTDRLVPGDDFDVKIKAAVAAADLGIFAVSTAFLLSRYIRDHELPPFLDQGTGKRIVPVLLKPLAGSTDLRGLAARQIHGYHRPYWAGQRPHLREQWARDLADQLHRVAREYGLGRLAGR